MANTTNVAIITTANTFDHWRIRDNLQANDVNEIARGNFIKEKGNVTVNEGTLTLANTSGGVLLTVKDDARVDGLFSVDTIESDGDGHVYLAAGDITMGNRAAGGLFQANINTKFDSANVQFSNANVFFSNTAAAALITVTPNSNFLTNVTVSGTMNVVQNAHFTGNTTNVTGNLIITGTTNVASNVIVAGTMNVNSNVRFAGTTANVTGNLILTGTANIASNVIVEGTVNANSNVNFTGVTANITGNLIHTGATANLSGNLILAGTANVASNVIVAGTMNVNSNVRFAGVTATVTGNLLATGATVNVSGNAIVTGTLNVTSNTILTGTLNVASNAHFTGTTTNVTGNLVATGQTVNISGNTIIDGGAFFFDRSIDKMSINSGTDAPEAELEVVGNTKVTTNLTVGTFATISANLTVGTSASIGTVANVPTVNTATIVATANVLTLSGGGATGANPNGNVIIVSGGSETVRVTNTSRVGINTQTPNSTLSVVGNVWVTTGVNAATVNATTLNVSGSANITTIRSNDIKVDTDASYYILNGNGVFNNLDVKGNLVITGTTTNDTDTILLRAAAASDGDGVFRVKRGTTGRGNAQIRFLASADVWQATPNANATPSHYTIITTQNVVDSISSTSTTDAAAPNAAKTAYDQGSNARDQANTARTQANTARTTANDAYGQANTATTNAGNAYGQANGAYGQANTARTTANDAYGQANTATTNAGNAYGQANGAYGQANTARDQANTARDQANTARTQANSAYGQANAAYAAANSAQVTVYANSASDVTTQRINFVNTATITVAVTNSGGNANVALTAVGGAAFDQANAAYGQANSARDQANTARTQANNAYGEANNRVSSVSGTSGRITSSGGLTPTIDLATAGAGAATYSSGISAVSVDAYGRVTSVTGSASYATTTQVGNAYNQANTATTNAGNAYGQANTAQTTAQNAYGAANTAQTTAQNAYGAANNRVLKSGDTMTGTLTINSGGIAVTGDANFESGTLFVQASTDRVGVGTSSPAEKLHVVGDVIATGNVTAYYSDDRLKNRLSPIENALDKVLQLNGFYFEPNETALQLGYGKTIDVGVSAQEVQKVLPESVAPAPIDNKYLAVRYEKLIPLLIEAIKELQNKIKQLENKNG